MTAGAVMAPAFFICLRGLGRRSLSLIGNWNHVWSKHRKLNTIVYWLSFFDTIAIPIIMFLFDFYNSCKAEPSVSGFPPPRE